MFIVESVPMPLRAIRGATLVSTNSAEAITSAVGELLNELQAKNGYTTDNLVTVFFTITPDLNALSPAKAARLTQGWQDVPLMCAAEPVIDGLPYRCIRVLVQFESEKARGELKPVYLNGANQLRPDVS